MNDVKKCPLFNNDCLENKCAWWDLSGAQCAVLGLYTIMGSQREDEYQRKIACVIRNQIANLGNDLKQIRARTL